MDLRFLFRDSIRSQEAVKTLGKILQPCWLWHQATQFGRWLVNRHTKWHIDRCPWSCSFCWRLTECPGSDTSTVSWPSLRLGQASLQLAGEETCRAKQDPLYRNKSKLQPGHVVLSAWHLSFKIRQVVSLCFPISSKISAKCKDRYIAIYSSVSSQFLHMSCVSFDDLEDLKTVLFCRAYETLPYRPRDSLGVLREHKIMFLLTYLALLTF